jgi:hypothetical protein
MLPLKALRQRARLKLSRLLPGTGRGSLYPAVLLRRVAPRPRWCWSSPRRRGCWSAPGPLLLTTRPVPAAASLLYAPDC